MTCDSDRSGEAGETRRGSTEGESAGRRHRPEAISINWRDRAEKAEAALREIRDGAYFVGPDAVGHPREIAAQALEPNQQQGER